MNEFAGYAVKRGLGWWAMLRLARDARPQQMPAEALRLLLLYDAKAGTLHWLPRPRALFTTEMAWRLWNARYSGKEAFTCLRDGYRIGILFRKAYSAHRVAWAIHHGEWPSDTIDHVNGDRSDNRIENLRDVSQIDNGRNQKLPRTNTSGVIGVYWYPQTSRWQVRIRVDGHLRHLGYFTDFDAAVRARKEAEISFGFHENHGRAV